MVDHPIRPRRAARLLALLTGVAIAGAAGLLVTELALRSTAAGSLYREVRRNPPHPFLQAVTSMAADHVNAQGFRGDQMAVPKPAGTFRIFTLGGSTTLGVTNRYEDSYPSQLQALLRQRFPDRSIEVMNAGCPWYTSAHALVSYTISVRQYDPDLIIFFEAINDLVRSFSPPWLATGPYEPDYSHYLGPYARMLGPEAAFFDASGPLLSWNHIRRWVGADPDPFDIRNRENVARLASKLTPVDRPPFRSLPSYRRFYDGLIHAVQADGRPIITVTQPSLFKADLSSDERSRLWFGPLLCADQGTCPTDAAMLRGMEAYNAAARDVSARRGVPLADAASAVPRTLEHFVDDVHMTAAGNAIVASTLAELIDRIGLLPERTSAPPTPAPRPVR